MSIDDHCRDLEGGAEDNIGGLAADAGEGGQGGQGGRNLAVVTLVQPLSTAEEMSGLGMIKTGGTDQRLDLGEIRLT